jgi:hypothetical protein
MNKERIYKILFSSVYPLYIKKVETKGRTKEELDTVIFWLTGYNKKTLQQQIDRKTDFQTFFAEAPKINPNASKITGVILWLPGGRNRRRIDSKNAVAGQAD